MDIVEEEGLKGDGGDKKKSVGRNNKDYRDFRRQSTKGGQRKGSVFGGMQERPARPTPKTSGIVVPPPKKRAKEAVGKYLLGDALGRGQFGLVFKGIDSENGAFVAIKQLKSNQLSEDSLKAFEAEIALLSKLDHPTVVRYLDCVRTTDHVNLVLEYCDGGALSSVLKKFGKVPEKLCALYTYQCLQGLEYLHSQGVVHRDIKCANILLTKSGKAKIADFGISTTANSPDGPDGGVGFGSPYWMAPEVIEMEVVPNEKADIWSLGCTVIELFTGNPPYHEYHPMGAIVKCVQDEHPPFPSGSSKDLEDFLLKCFQKDIEKRSSAKDLLDHPWFNPIKEQLNFAPTPSIEKAKPVETKEQEPATPIIATRQIKIYGESIRADAPSKIVFITDSTTVEEVVQLVLIKYNVREDPSKYAMFVENLKTAESKQLDEYELIMPITSHSQVADFQFSVKLKTDTVRRKEGLLLLKRSRRLPFLNSYFPVRIIVDLDERYVVFFRGDRPSNDFDDDPVFAVYNLRMIKGVVKTEGEEGKDSKKNDFTIIHGKNQHHFRAPSPEALAEWLSFFKTTISIARPLHLGASTTLQRGSTPKKGRESKLIDMTELINNRPRLASNKTTSSSSNEDAQLHCDTSAPETPVS